MSKTSKTKRSLERRNARRSARETRKQHYAALRDSKMNQKISGSSTQRRGGVRSRTPVRNRRTTYDVEVIGRDGTKHMVRRGGTLTAKQFGFKNLRTDKAKRNR